MGVLHQIEVELYDRQNRTLMGSLLIESYPGLTSPGDDVTSVPANREDDPKGASSYVIAVVLIYGLSIVFLIGSHVFIKKKEENVHGEEQKLVEYFLQNSARLAEITNKETYKKLKTSIVPIVAKSSGPARDLISRRKSFLPFLASAGILLADPGGLMSGLKDGANGRKDPECTDTEEQLAAALRKTSTATAAMPIIGEEDEEEEEDDDEEEEDEDEEDDDEDSQSDSSDDQLEHALRGCIQQGFSGESYDYEPVKSDCTGSRSDIGSQYDYGFGITVEREPHIQEHVPRRSRSDSIGSLMNARMYMNNMMSEHGMAPQTAGNMYKLVWLSTSDGSPHSSRNSSVAGDAPFLYDPLTPAIHASLRESISSLTDHPPLPPSRRTSTMSNPRWSTEEVPRIPPPPVAPQRANVNVRRASYAATYVPRIRPPGASMTGPVAGSSSTSYSTSFSSTSSSDHDHARMNKITSL